MLLSAVSVLVVAQSSSEIPEGLMNNPVLAGYINRKAVFLFSLQSPSGIFPILSINERDITINIHRSSWTVTVIRVRF